MPPEMTRLRATKVALAFAVAGLGTYLGAGLGVAGGAYLRETGKALIGDTGYDSNGLLAAVRDKGMRPVIHSKPERHKKHRLVRKLYRQRYLVETSFHSLKAAMSVL